MKATKVEECDSRVAERRAELEVFAEYGADNAAARDLIGRILEGADRQGLLNVFDSETKSDGVDDRYAPASPSGESPAGASPSIAALAGGEPAYPKPR